VTEVRVSVAGWAPLLPAAREIEELRAAARAGTRAEHFVVAADASRAHAGDVREVLERDAAAGVQTRVIDGASALPMIGLAPPFAVREESRVERDGTVSEDPRDVAEALAAVALLRDDVRPQDELVLPEPLLASAPIARHVAAAICPGCGAYHGLLQTLRLLAVTTSPQRHGRFYRDQLGEVAARGGARVLIAGAADYAMLAHALAAFVQAGVRARVLVVDRCPTPLALSRWYAATERTAIATATSDLAAFEPSEPVDVVITDSLLTLLEPAARVSALARWGAALTAEGRIVTTLRLLPASGWITPRPEQIEDFVGWVLDEARLRAALVPLDLADLAEDARSYAEAPMRSWPVSGVEELEAIVHEAGLRVEHLEVLELDGRGARVGAGPGAHRDATYARIVLRRR
jgi:hypothetical protein